MASVLRESVEPHNLQYTQMSSPHGQPKQKQDKRRIKECNLSNDRKLLRVKNGAKSIVKQCWTEDGATLGSGTETWSRKLEGSLRSTDLTIQLKLEEQFLKQAFSLSKRGPLCLNWIRFFANEITLFRKKRLLIDQIEIVRFLQLNSDCWVTINQNRWRHQMKSVRLLSPGDGKPLSSNRHSILHPHLKLKQSDSGLDEETVR